AGTQLTMTGSLLNLTEGEGLASVYSGGNLQISGTEIVNRGGSIAAAGDLALSGRITNTHTGEVDFVAGKVTTDKFYTGLNPLRDAWGWHEASTTTVTVTRHDRVITTYESELNGKQGLITSGRDMSLSGHITNNYGAITAKRDLDISGEDFISRSAPNQTITQATAYRETWGGGCLVPYMHPEDGMIGCAEPNAPRLLDTVEIGPLAPETNYGSGTLGTVVAGRNITGNLKGKVELITASPIDPENKIVQTDVDTARDNISRGSAGTVTFMEGRALSIRANDNITLVDAAGIGEGALGNEVVVREGTVLSASPEVTIGVSAGSEIDAAQLQQALAGQAEAAGGLDEGQVAQAEVDKQVTLASWQDSRASSVPYSDAQMARSGSVPNTDAVAQKALKTLSDSHAGIIAEQDFVLNAGSTISLAGSNLPADNTPVGQNVFMTDEQLRVLTEDLGFDAGDINTGQQALYAAISLNDLLPDGVTLSAGGIIDIYAAEGMRIDAGVHAGDGLMLRTDGTLETKDTTFLDSDTFIGLEIGGDFTNTMALNSDELWLDIGGSFTNSGSMAGGWVEISAGKDMQNLGSLSGTHIGVTAGGNLLNTGSMIAEGLLNLNAGANLINQGGHLEGYDVSLSAGGDIINRTEYSQHTYTDSQGNSRTYTLVGPASDIISHNNLSLEAGHDIDLQGSKFSAANNIDIAAGNDVLLGAVEHLSGHEKYFKGGHDIEVHRTYEVVSLDAGNNLSIRAGNNLESEGAQFSAGNIASLIAENEMNLLAVVESHYDADKTTKKSTFSKRVTETVSLHEEVQGTGITAGTILLNADVDEDGQVVKAAAGDITLVGGALHADNDIIAFGKDITITAGTYQDYEYSHTSKSRFGGLSSKSKEELAQDDLLSGATVSAGGNLLLQADNDIAVIASGLSAQDIGLKAFNEILIASGEESRLRESRSQSGGFLSGGSLYSATEAVNGTLKTTANSASVDALGNLVIEAGSATVIGSTLDADGGIRVKTDIGDIKILAAKETEHSYEYRKALNVGLGDVLKVFSDPAGLLKETYERSKESGRATLTIANADYLESETTTDITRHKGSEVTAKNGITFESVGNINIEGSYIDADVDGDDEGALRLKAGGNIRVADVTDTFSQNSKTTTGSAQVNVMVTHQAAEVANAAVAVKEATDQLEQTRRNYKAWEQQQDELKQQLAKLENELAQGKPGVTRADIDDLRTQIDILSTDEAWHLANIAVATTNLYTASQNLYHQSAAAYNSSATYGFNAGLELNLNAAVTESQVLETYSVGAFLSGAGVSFETGEDGTLEIAGSWADSTKEMTLDVGNLVMTAGKNTHDSQTQSKQGNINISQTVWGAAAGGPAVSGSLNLSEARNHSTTYTNAGLTAGGKMTVDIKGDADLAGATLHADKGLTANIGGDLTLTSVQDVSYGSNKGVGVSGGVSFGGKYTNDGGAGADPKQVALTTAIGETTGAQSANAGVSLENGRYFSKETVLSGITAGGPTDITVGGHTALTGALIASVDEDGLDTGQLKLDTKGLSFTDLTNTYYSSNSSLSLNTNVMLGDTPVPAKPEQTGVTNQPQDSKGENQPSGTTNVGIHQGSSYGKGKTLATIGNGSIIVGGEETEPEGLNRDVDNIDKELYSIERTKGDLDVTIQNKTLEQLVDAVDSVIDTLNKASPELAGNVADAADNLQQGASDSVEGKDTTGQQIAEKAEDINQREAESLLAQELVLPALGEPGDAPELIGKSFDEQVSELTALKSLQEGNFAAGEQSAEEAFQNGYIKGWESASGNGGNGWISPDADYESYINHRQNEIDGFNQFTSELSGPGAFAFYGGANLYEGAIGLGESIGGLTRFTGVQGGSAAGAAWTDLGTGLQNLA
ncbi:hemagglutinin repeat-containing protein, partial [Chromatiaceae bacterium AAb-1]|nr:hemagglutinin repeat-containing protein [Chromatiaceae bacterium AAb-1]